jgi:hypothetical protein
MRGVLQQMVAGRLYDWSEAELSLQALQSRLIKLEKFHPAPPERVFRGIAAANERVSNLIYQMADQMGELLRGQYQTSTLNALLGQVQELQSQVFTGRVLLDEARRRESGGRADLPPHTQEVETTRILQLSRLNLEQVRCRMVVADQWIDVESFDDDPQLLLPVIRGSGGKVQLRLSCIAESHEALQIYWAFGDDPFSVENLRTVPADSSVVSVNLVLDVADGNLLRVRIDPITGIGASRLHGSLGGVFALVEQEPARTGEAAGPVAAAAAETGGGTKRAATAARTTRRSALR